MQNVTVILASQSPRRIELLRQIVKNFRVIPSGVNEICSPNLSPEENAIALGQKKAAWVAKQNPHDWVIGADTLVVLKNTIIGKPANFDEACQTLRLLSGREHTVITGVAVVHSKTKSAAIVSKVRIKTLTDNEIKTYVNSEEPMDKAGAYAIQGKGASIVESYEGSYSNIIGLPIESLKDLLTESDFPFKKLS